VLLGGIGTLSLVIDPILWLAGGNSLREVITEADQLFVLIAPIRTVHLAAVIAALAFMFLPAANTYFRGGRWAERCRADWGPRLPPWALGPCRVYKRSNRLVRTPGSGYPDLL
jgi:hypothetical protein